MLFTMLIFAVPIVLALGILVKLVRDRERGRDQRQRPSIYNPDRGAAGYVPFGEPAPYVPAAQGLFTNDASAAPSPIPDDGSRACAFDIAPAPSIGNMDFSSASPVSCDTSSSSS